MTFVKHYLPHLFVIAGFLGLIVSGILTIESMKVLKNPDYTPPCNISPFISCGTVMDSPQSSLLGFPNALLGVAGFSAIMTIGFALLAGARFKRWFWVFIQLGLTLAAVAVYWFFAQSVFVINSLCPWCMVFWAATISLFWYTTVHNLSEDNIISPFKASEIRFGVQKYPHLPLLVLYGSIVLSIFIRFWPYWATLISR